MAIILASKVFYVVKGKRIGSPLAESCTWGGSNVHIISACTKTSDFISMEAHKGSICTASEYFKCVNYKSQGRAPLILERSQDL